MTSTPSAVTGCGPSCGCTPDVPIACTLDADGIASRIDDWDRVLAPVISRSPLHGGLRLVFGPGLDVAELTRLIVAEQGCCAYYRFVLAVDERGIGLEVTAPEDAAAVLRSMFGSAG